MLHCQCHYTDTSRGLTKWASFPCITTLPTLKRATNRPIPPSPCQYTFVRSLRKDCQSLGLKVLRIFTRIYKNPTKSPESWVGDPGSYQKALRCCSKDSWGTDVEQEDSLEIPCPEPSPTLCADDADAILLRDSVSKTPVSSPAAPKALSTSASCDWNQQLSNAHFSMVI